MVSSRNNILLAMVLLVFSPAGRPPVMERIMARDGFVLVPKGQFLLGKEGDRVNPPHTVRADSFRIAIYETTNREFAAFVAATSYVTDAERMHNAMVFAPGLPEFRWIQDSTANWHWPNGVTRGGIRDKMDHPVTCISYRDVQKYCDWAKVRLPTLDEWEIACRAGTHTDYFFGSDYSHIGEYANIWHRHDHLKKDFSDGYMYTSPVGSFKPNPWGLYDMYGNVFEFCTGKTSVSERPGIAHARGGSWWCSMNTCQSFNSYSIGQVNIHASFSNQGFRVVLSAQSQQTHAQPSHPALVITPLTRDLYIYTTWGITGGQPFPANGMYLVTSKGVLVMDSPWDTTQFQPLLDTIWQRHHQPVVLCIATHFHEDRTAALDFFRTKGVKTYTSRLTDAYSREHGDHRAEFLFDKDTVFTVGGYSVQTFYPGEGHTRDNIVVWFGRDRVLYGGCLIKSTESPTLGNVSDGNISAYAATIRRVIEKFPDPAYIIPGHQSWAAGSLQHTLEMAEQAATTH